MLRAAGFALALAACTTAQAAVITFEDRTCDSGMIVTDGYAGLNWDKFGCIDGTAFYTDSGYFTGRVSGKNVTFNNFTQPAEITTTVPGGPKFNLHSVYLTAAFNEGLEVKIEAWRGGALVSTTVRTLTVTHPTLVQLSLWQVDRVRFSTSGGVTIPAYSDGDPSDQTHLAMDNLDIDFTLPAATSVPTMSEWALALLATAIAALAFSWLLRRRRGQLLG